MTFNKTTLLIFLVLALSVNTHSKSNTPDAPVKLSVGEVAKFIEGLLYGVLSQEFPDIEACLIDVSAVEGELIRAVQDFELESFDGAEKGLEELGKVAGQVPTLVKDCKSVQADLTNLVKMGEVFKHPLTLLYKVGKNLIVNGVDIFTNIAAAVDAYKQGDYFTFGKHVGQALVDVLLKDARTKTVNDDAAYQFISGFLRASDLQFDYERLYNNVDGLGIMIYYPVKDAMKKYDENNGQLNEQMWMSVHEISHIFLEGGMSLVAKDALDEETVDQLREISDCFDYIRFQQSNSDDVNSDFGEASHYFNVGKIDKVGEVFARIAGDLCREIPKSEHHFLK